MRRDLWMFITVIWLVFCPACDTYDFDKDEGKQAKSYSSEVITKWLDLQLDLLRVPLPAGTGSQAAERALAYCGIAAYEAVVPGMPSYKSISGQLNGSPLMAIREPGKSYHWAASANAALAEMNRLLFPTTSAANKLRIDSLEGALRISFNSQADSATILRSIQFGREIAARIFKWAASDGSSNVYPVYVPPVGPGLWESTAPNFPAAVNPYASQRRLMVPGVASGTALEPPPVYSTDPSSPFYAMVKDVYNKSQALTTDQRAMAIYHRDAPGYPGGGHFVAVLSQVFKQTKIKLDKAVLAYAKSGLAIHDAVLICFTQKYTINMVRPITYIRNIMGYKDWNALFNTPGHPEFPSAHAVNGAAVATMLTDVLGSNVSFSLNTYDYLGLPERKFSSFFAMAKEMADSRVYGGIHYQASCDKGRSLGEKISNNILKTIQFKN